MRAVVAGRGWARNASIAAPTVRSPPVIAVTPRHAPDQAPSVQDQLMAGFMLTLAVPQDEVRSFHCGPVQGCSVESLTGRCHQLSGGMGIAWLRAGRSA